MKSKIVIMLAAISFALLTACNTVNSVERRNPTAHKQVVTDSRVITDRDFQQRVSIFAVNEVSDGEFLKIQVELWNNTSSKQSFSYKFEWFDENSMLIDSVGGSMMTRTIEGGESMMLIGVAPTPKAKDFRLKLIEK